MRWEDSSLAVGVASILLPSAAEGSCPVELGNPPILALTLMRHKGCTVLRIRFLLHQCGALKSLLSLDTLWGWFKGTLTGDQETQHVLWVHAGLPFCLGLPVFLVLEEGLYRKNQ